MIAVAEKISSQAVWQVWDAIAQGTLYDDFSGTTLDPDKWAGEQHGTGLELTRAIQAGTLLMSHRVAGDTTSDVGTHVSGNALVFTRRDLGAVMFDLNVASVSATRCPGSASSRAFAVARADLPLFFGLFTAFNAPLITEHRIGAGGRLPE